jgi:hypothetical protein
MTKFLDLLNRKVKEFSGRLEVGIILMETYGLKDLLFTADYKRFDPSFGKICAKLLDNLMQTICLQDRIALFRARLYPV